MGKGDDLSCMLRTGKKRQSSSLGRKRNPTSARRRSGGKGGQEVRDIARQEKLPEQNHRFKEVFGEGVLGGGGGERPHGKEEVESSTIL